jgi:hypothetical protein
MQFVEQYDAIAALTNNDTLISNCDTWKTHSETVGIEQDDSGV